MGTTKKYKAEAFDIMQYFYGTAHNPLIHCVIYFSSHIDGEVLKKVVTLSVNAISQIKCCFESPATLNDMVMTVYTRALYRKTGTERIILPCPVDLRK